MYIPDLMENLKPFIFVETSSSVKDALEALRQAEGSFALLVNSDRAANSKREDYPVALLEESQLVALAIANPQPSDPSHHEL